MDVLLVKLSSMGDLIQALPALSDAQAAHPDIRIDWVVDEAFAEIPTWHPAVRTVIPSAHRRWRKNLSKAETRKDLKRFKNELRGQHYQSVIDAQNNLKSAVVTAMARGTRHGPDKQGVRERPAHLAYQSRHEVPRNQLAINRWRQLFSQALEYPLPDTALDFGLSQKDFPVPESITADSKTLLFVHNASWGSKLWNIKHWQSLAKIAINEGHKILLPWGNTEERRAAELIAGDTFGISVLPRLSLSELAGILRRSAGAICMDTGLAHLAAALDARCLTLYGPTDPKLIAATGNFSVQMSAQGFDCMHCYQRECLRKGQRYAVAQCLNSLGAEQVWEQFKLIDYPAHPEL